MITRVVGKTEASIANLFKNYKVYVIKARGREPHVARHTCHDTSNVTLRFLIPKHIVHALGDFLETLTTIILSVRLIAFDLTDFVLDILERG